jgi:hypothetical protein
MLVFGVMFERVAIRHRNQLRDLAAITAVAHGAAMQQQQSDRQH